MRSLSLVVILCCSFFGQAFAAGTSENEFYNQVQGRWSGAGEIIAGKFKNTKFTCAFDGISPNEKTGIEIDGKCRIGLFAQPMRATVARVVAGHTGKFMDGADGDGLDVVGARYTDSRLAVDIRRKDLQGVMAARLTGPENLHITVSVHVRDKLVPVIVMSLDRVGDAVDRTTTSSID